VPGAGRLGDKAQVSGPGDAHGCPACPHPAIGPAIIGSPTVNVNRRPALRVDDTGVHAACCGTNTWTATQGAPTVFINDKAAFRINDPGRTCGGINRLIEGSSNVIIGNDSSAPAPTSSPSSSRTSSTAGGGGGSPSAPPPAPASPAPAPASSPSPSAPPPPPRAAPVDEQQIEVQLVNALGEPQAHVAYELTLPDGTVKSGTTGSDGYLRYSGLTQGGDARLVLPDVGRSPR